MLYLHKYVKSNYPNIFFVIKKGKFFYFKITNYISYIFFFTPALILKVLNFELLNINIQRVGHLTFDAESYIKERILEKRSVRTILLAPYGAVANDEFLKYISGYMFILRNKFFCLLLRPLLTHPLCAVNASLWGEGRKTFKSFLIHSQWESQGLPPLSKLTQNHMNYGKKRLIDLGVPDNAWYVCFHNRESGYSKYSHDFDQSFRNSSIRDYQLAMQEIVDRGGWCIRMGDPTMEPLVPSKGIIDYANSPLRSESMDIFLCATARVFLGNSSGLALLAAFFDTPVGAANVIPLAGVLMQGQGNITIPKLIAYKDSGKLCSFGEIFDSDVGSFRTATEFKESKYMYINNSPEEILDLLKEMLGDKDVMQLPEYEVLQLRFKRLIKKHHWCYYGSSRVGSRFLLKYKDYISH